MGAGESSALVVDAELSAGEVGLGDLPESCVAAVMVHLDSAEICRLARLSRSFRGAAAADLVWETKLPANYRYLIEKARSCSSSGSDEEEVAMTKKGIYARLCRPIPFDGGTKEFWMEKSRGGICMAISSKGLVITGIEDRRYWNYIPTDESRIFFESAVNLHEELVLFLTIGPGVMRMERDPHLCSIYRAQNESWEIGSHVNGCSCLLGSQRSIVGIGILVHVTAIKNRFHTVAYLQQIWWLEVAGEVDFCFPAGTYSLYFRLHLGRATRRLGRRICNHEHMHGWNIKPVKFQLWTSAGQHALSQYYLDEPGCWNRYHVGDFLVEKPDMPSKVKFSMTQIDCTHTKGGVCVDSVLIYPKGFRQDKYFRTYM